jgi:hypothetical protein
MRGNNHNPMSYIALFFVPVCATLRRVVPVVVLGRTLRFSVWAIYVLLSKGLKNVDEPVYVVASPLS